jgi:4-amino-4-deoxy-L-arabinose transferase-like glycosyltransferase
VPGVGGSEGRVGRTGEHHVEFHHARAGFWGVLALALLLLTVRTGDVPLIDPDEARFARTSVEMQRSGDLVVPTFENEPRVVKPPLLHWIHVPLFRTFGAHPWTARLPAVLATLVSIALTGWIAARRFGPEGALWAAAVMATSPLVLAGGRIGTLDALLAVHVLAIVALDIAEPGEVGPYRALAMGALAGLAFLVKGPVGVVVPVIVLLAGRTAAGRNVLPSATAASMALAGWCALVLPWGLVFLERLGGGSIGAVLNEEVLARIVGGTVHVRPPWFYAPVMLLGFVPWVVPMTAALVRVLLRRRDPAVRTATYAGAGLLAGLLLFSLSRGKLPNYLLPLAPLVAILVTWELGQELDDPHERRLPAWLTCGALGLFAVVLMIAASVPDLPAEARLAAGLGSAAQALGALGAFVGVLRRRPRQVYGFAAGAGFAFLLAVTTVFLPAHGARRSAHDLVRDVPALQSARPVAVVEMNLPSLTFYLDRAPEKLFVPDLSDQFDRSDAPLLVFDRRDLDAVEPEVRARLREVGAAGKYVVCTPGPRTAEGGDPP